MLLWALAAAEAGWQAAHQRGGAQETGGLLDESRGTADGSGNTCALVEGAGLETFSVLIVGPIQVTAHCHQV